jgi:hypothetical protein
VTVIPSFQPECRAEIYTYSAVIKDSLLRLLERSSVAVACDLPDFYLSFGILSKIVTALDSGREPQPPSEGEPVTGDFMVILAPLRRMISVGPVVREVAPHTCASEIF